MPGVNDTRPAPQGVGGWAGAHLPRALCRDRPGNHSSPQQLCSRKEDERGLLSACCGTGLPGTGGRPRPSGSENRYIPAVPHCPLRGSLPPGTSLHRVLLQRATPPRALSPCHATFPVPTFMIFLCPPPTRPTLIPPPLLLLPQNVSEVQTFLSSSFPGLHPASSSQQFRTGDVSPHLRRTRQCSPLRRIAGQAETPALRRRMASHRRKQQHVLKCSGRGQELAERQCRAEERGSECGVQGRLGRV